MTRHLVTAALPYANGPIHIGHLVEYVQTDIYVRYLRSMDEDAIYVCADDTHGTPVELKAMQLGITPDALVAQIWEEHTRDFGGFGMSFDVYYSTNSPENRELAGRVYQALVAAGHVVRKSTEQMYSEKLGRFLTDRMVKGTCPKCKAPDQYGDVCESCGKTHDPTDLIDPYEPITGDKPVLRATENLYVRLSEFTDFLREWLPAHVPQDAVRNSVAGWVDGGLQDWCVSRDAPYFGFEIPGEPGKYFYVWLDAPIGYIAATWKYCKEHGLDWEKDFWGPDADARITHVIGKDIVYFHTLFWPAMLHAAGLKTPERIQVHGMLTFNGAKMSKARGTLIKARTYLDHLDAEYLRFYYASKLGADVGDFDLNLDDFATRVNAELVNNIVNFANRVLTFLGSRFDGKPGAFDPAAFPLVDTLATGVQQLQSAYADWNYRAVMRTLNELGSEANTFFQDSAPWALIKEDPAAAHAVCTVGLHAACVLMAGLAPITPRLNGRFAQCVGLESIGWEHARADWKPETVGAKVRLLDRVDPAVVTAMFDQSVAEAQAATAAPPQADAVEVASFKDEIEFDDFARVDLRVGVVEEVEAVKGANKLLRLTVNCGQRINVFAGVAKAYPDPSVLLGKRVVVVANLKPRKMRFGLSQGMLLAASGADDEGLQLLTLGDNFLGGWSVG